SRRSGTTHVYLRQTVAGLEVVGTEVTVNVGRAGGVVHAAGTERFVPAVQRVDPSPGLPASAAAEALARSNGLRGAFAVIEARGGSDRAATLSSDVALEPVPARLVWHRGEDGALRLAW